MPKSAKGEIYKKKYTEEDLEAALQAIQNDSEKIVGQNIVSRLISVTPDKSNCFYKALKDIYDHLKGKDIEQEDCTILSEYLVIDNELVAINDISIVISNPNNIEEYHARTIETETIEITETES
ncbi:unnamed protein product [Parnassius mnemosyne]|uniref:Uncharacterized protein n=1 Tax=Parnassius mnemosyne TaxID=213953 RepID=A0AAV1LHK7_9NEOP